MKEYSQKSGELARQHGGKYLIRGPAFENFEGDKLEGQIVILSEFPSMDELQAFIKSDEYQNNIKHLRNDTGEYHISFYEGTPSS
jgi:uncharacterized protein (DUF1330 family)